MNLSDLEKTITELVIKELESTNRNNFVHVGVSARHIHLCQNDLDILFGKGYKLTEFKPLSQPGQFAAEEKVELITDKGSIKGVRILGPVRNVTQVELAKSETRILGLKGIVRSSGDIANTEGLTIVGPKGRVSISEGVIIADRHIHMTPLDAKHFGVKDGDVVSVKVPGKKGGIMGEVLIRVSDNYALDCHIDTDDANAFGIVNGTYLEVIR